MSKTINNAADLLKKYNIDSAPVDLNKILSKEGFTLSVVDLSEVEKQRGGEISGLLIVDKEGKGIAVNKNDSLERRRFTIAHELGHYYLHNTEVKNNNGNISFYRQERNPSETEANTFAAELLMPEELVRMQHKKLMVPYLSDLATAFDVSKEAMHIRLKILNLEYEDL